MREPHILAVTKNVANNIAVNAMPRMKNFLATNGP
jgi:hypothetical protein